MNLNPKTVLNHVFGYADFRKDQAEIVERLISGHDALVLMPTGGGIKLTKSPPQTVPRFRLPNYLRVPSHGENL